MTLPSKKSPLRDNIDKALLVLMDLDLCSMTWDAEREDFLFYMTDEQKAKHDALEDPDAYIRKHGKIK
jgi:hypothetical protein